MTYGIIRGKKRIPLTSEEIMEVYRIQELNFRIEDVKSHAKDLGIRLCKNDCEIIAKNFLNNIDCDIPENSMIDASIIEYVRKVRKV